jgi:phosphoglycolate phosphatase-like HAD superfamily hydrolase
MRVTGRLLHSLRHLSALTAVTNRGNGFLSSYLRQLGFFSAFETVLEGVEEGKGKGHPRTDHEGSEGE